MTDQSSSAAPLETDPKTSTAIASVAGLGALLRISFFRTLSYHVAMTDDEGAFLVTIR